MSGWDNFFLAQAGASAALAGLVFVGISINLAKILSFPGLPNLGLAALTALTTVLIASSFVLVPGQRMAFLGLELLVVGLAAFGITAYACGNSIRDSERRYRRRLWFNLVFGLLAMLLLVAGAIVVLVHGEGGLYVLVPAMLLCYLVAIAESWVLLVEINR